MTIRYIVMIEKTNMMQNGDSYYTWEELARLTFENESDAKMALIPIKQGLRHMHRRFAIGEVEQ